MLILASASLGRKKLLDYLKIPYEIIPSKLDEEKIIGKTPLDTLRLRARLKAEKITKKVVSSAIHFILSADSGAILAGKLYGKPKDRSDAIRILKLLSDRTHRFITAVNIIKKQNNITKSILETTDESQVTFRKITKEDIDYYLTITNYTLFAGSYALISAQNFITKVEGSLSNIIGLPLEVVIPVLQKNNLIS